MSDVIIGGKRVRLDPARAFGKGGEADVFDIGSGVAVKLFKPPTHPDLSLDPAAQRAAAERIAVHQRKLPAFPKGLPSRVVTPVDLATDKAGKVVGYAMPLLAGAEPLMSYGQPAFRQHVSVADALPVLRDLCSTIPKVHAAGCVIGDFNDLNVLVRNSEAHLIDADSFSFGPFQCRTFTSTFVDPLVCDPSAAAPMLVGAHSPDTDWYAFTVMVMQTLLCVGPYGGVYRPTSPAKAVQHAARSLHRITVFNPDVRYPRHATPIDRLPDDILHRFQEVFTRDVRGAFPAALLETRWTKCDCGAEHARATCPACQKQAPAAVVTTTAIRGKVTATTLLRTSGAILRVERRPDGLDVLLAEGGHLRLAFVGGGIVQKQVDLGQFQPEPGMRYRIGPKRRVFIGMGADVVEIVPGTGAKKFAVDVHAQSSMIDANAENFFWARGGVLLFDGSMGPERIGDVLEGQTAFWVGDRFGFGFYRAGNLSRAFTFTAQTGSLNDSVKMPPICGKLIDAECYFAGDRVWFLTTTQENASRVNRCCVMRRDGTVEGSAETSFSDGSWLGQLHGGSAVGGSLFMPTDDGIVQAKLDKGMVSVAKTFPDTELFVDGGGHIFAMPDGMYVIRGKTITRLTIGP